MSKSSDALKLYAAARDRIVALADSVKAWQSELQAVESEVVTLADQRITALTNDDVPTADKLHQQIEAKQARAADLRAMIAKREGEISQAAYRLFDNETQTVRLAAVEDVTIEKQQARAAVEKLAPNYNRALARFQAAQAGEMGVVGYEAEALDVRNREAFRASLLFQLLGSGEAKDYQPSWLKGA